MMIKALCVLTVVALFAQEGFNEDVEENSGAQNPNEPKERNYQKFVGEREYLVPFKTRISQPFKDGQTVHVVGSIKPDAKRMDFNFHVGAEKGASLPLHFSIRFDEGKLVYNTFKDGKWGKGEQRIKNPFRANDDFDLRIRILGDKYQIFANRVEVATFDQRMPIDGVDHVSMGGDAKGLSLFHYGGRIFPIPYAAQAKLLPAKRLDLSLLPTGDRFNINLYRKNQQYALQLSVRFNEGVVVRNAMNSTNQWGREEREGILPINKGEIVDITIINEPYSFQIFFNGKRFTTFAHRNSPDDIQSVEIDGDTELHTITINDALGV